MKPLTSVKKHTHPEDDLYIGHIYLKLIFDLTGQRLNQWMLAGVSMADTVLFLQCVHLI